MPLSQSFPGNGTAATFYLWDDQSENAATSSSNINGNTLEVFYGPEKTMLPFSLRLNDFVLERYPGSNSPSGYKSEVVLIDKVANVERPFTVFMNNILKYKGYRFYQSSYDTDEMGTILSVNHDFAGMMVTYSGYLLFLFIIFINKNCIYYTVTPGYWNCALRKASTYCIPFRGSVMQTGLDADKIFIGIRKDMGPGSKGRTKPLFTLSNDILRKVTRENNFEGMTSMQVFLGIYFDFDNWKEVPLIRVSNKELQQSLGIRGNLASFSDLVNLDNGGSYKLTEEVNKAYTKAPGARTKFDKEIMKVDERVNIVYMIYSGGFIKMFPLRDGSHSWGSPQEALKNATGKEDSLYLNNIIPIS
jgi:hypothetical protein